MLLLKNGLINTMVHSPFSGDILIDGHKIVTVGSDLSAPEGTEIIDVSGKTLLPGFIDAHCHIGMFDDGMGEEGSDGNEFSNPSTPELRAIDGLDPFDPCFREAREAGITTVVTGPGSANVIGGTFLALKTEGRCAEEMILRNPVAMKSAFGENPKSCYREQKEAPYTRMAIASIFRKTLSDALEYEKKNLEGKNDPDKKPDLDLGLEALLPVLHGDLPMKMHAHRADDILTALRLAKEFHLRVTIDHCTEGYLIPDLLRERTEEIGAGIIIGPLLSDRSKIELKNLSYKSPKVLHDHGIRFAMMTDHPVIPIQYLPVTAALAVRYGLDEQTALASITKDAAEITGLSDRIGTLEPGKDADITVFSGDPLDVRSHCLLTLINGKIVHKDGEFLIHA